MSFLLHSFFAFCISYAAIAILTGVLFRVALSDELVRITPILISTLIAFIFLRDAVYRKFPVIVMSGEPLYVGRRAWYWVLIAIVLWTFATECFVAYGQASGMLTPSTGNA